jgi:phage shock protein A
MAILDRISRLIRANINDLISRAEDPAKVIDQALADMRDAYYQARNEVAAAMADSAKIEREQHQNDAQSAEYQSKAEEALRLGREDLAREALRRKKNADDLSAAFASQLDKQRGTTDQLRTQLRALESKIDELESRKKLLAARQTTVQAQEKLDRVSGFDRADGAMQAFEQMEQKVQGMEDQASARGQLRKDADIDSQLEDLGRDREIEDELAALKAKVSGGSGQA